MIRLCDDVLIVYHTFYGVFNPQWLSASSPFLHILLFIFFLTFTHTHIHIYTKFSLYPLLILNLNFQSMNLCIFFYF